MFLYHYYSEEQGPFRNLSSLPVEEAEQILGQIKQKGVGFASRRSDDYLLIRHQLEQQARALFISKGGIPQNLYPHYMTLGACPWIESWFPDGRVLRIPLEEVKEDAISFTYGDLFPTMRYDDGKTYRGQVYTKQEILEMIRIYGFPQDWNPDGKLGPERYIEAQLWVDPMLTPANRSMR